MKNNFILFFLLLISALLKAQNTEPENHWWVTNGTVESIVKEGNTVYIGGFFSQVMANTPYGASISAATGQPNLNFARPNADVNITVPDGNGGWYIGGTFTAVAGQTRNRIARINSDGTLNPWNPNANSAVRTIVVSGTTVYAGGDFTSIGGQLRNRIAAIDATTGLATSWNPNADNNVRTIAVNGTTVYAGGDFTTISGQTRNRIAAIDAATGLATTWNPNSNNIVRAIGISGTTVYVGGDFTSIGGQTRNRIAAINDATGLSSSWNPNANNIVYTIAIDGNTLYAGGEFTNIGGVGRYKMAAINAATGFSTTWNPNPTSPGATTVESIAISGGTVYAAGSFSIIGGQARNNIAAIDATTGLATAWNPNANKIVRTIAINGAVVYAGGIFGGTNMQLRNYIAAIDATTGVPTSWNPNVNDNVDVIVVSGNTVYVGGSFDSIGGQTRNTIGAIDATTALPTSWDPDTNGLAVSRIIVSGNTVYIGGDFTIVGGLTRNRVAAIDATTGIPTSWNPNVNNNVYAMALGNNVLYVGGTFTNVGGLTRNRIAAINLTTGTTTTWNPNANNSVLDIAVNGNRVYAGGAFTVIGGQARNRMAAIDATTGTSISWNPNVNDIVRAIRVSDNTVYIGGDFSAIGGQARTHIGSADAITAVPTPWNPYISGDILDIFTDSGKIYLGGYLPSTNIDWTKGYVVFGNTCTLTTTGTQTNVLCHGQATGTATVSAIGGTGVYTYSWNTTPVQTTATATGLAAGTYTVTVTDPNGCLGTQTFTITEPSAPLVATAASQTNVLCYGNATGTATVNVTGGTETYTYGWNTTPVQTAATATSLTAGTYTVTVTDANLCTTTQSFTITEPQQLVIIPNTTQTNVLCNGQATGSATIAVNGGILPYTYLWSNGQTSNTITGLTAGTYTVDVTDANGCALSNSFTITEPDNPLIATAGSQTDVLCHGNATGSATVNATGGTGAYSYSWNTSPVQTAATATGLTAGNYTVTVTDTNGCTATQSFTITQPSESLTFLPNSSQTNIGCGGQTTGSATIVVNGGTSPYSYLWSNGETTSTITNLTAGTYTVTVTDANGCTINTSITITQSSSSLQLTTSQVNVDCATDTDGSITINATGGTGPYTYVWSPAVSTTNFAENLAVGNYNVVVTDANGCWDIRYLTIIAPNAVTGYFTVTDADCYTPGSATIHATGGIPPYTYSWSNGNTTPNLENVAPGTYTVTITDTNGCSYVLSTTIYGTTPIIVTSAPQSVTINGGETVIFTVEAQNVAYYQWQVSTDGGQTFSNLNAGGSIPGYNGVATPALTITNAYQALDGYQYRVILMQQNGCYILSDAAILTVNAPIVGVDETTKPEVNIYPNPASTEVFVKIPDFGAYKNIALSIYDLNGRLVKNENNITSDEYKIDVTGLELGVYIITITTDKGKTDKKLIINKKL